jgi:hypothetical protein
MAEPSRAALANRKPAMCQRIPILRADMCQRIPILPSSLPAQIVRLPKPISNCMSTSSLYHERVGTFPPCKEPCSGS